MSRWIGVISTLTLGCGAVAPDVEAVEAQLLALRREVVAHRDGAPAMGTAEGCRAELGRYREAMEPHLRRMRELGDEADGCMHAMGRHDDATWDGMCRGMESELARHAGEGCASGDRGLDRAEVEAHCARMLERLDEVTARAAGVRRMMTEGRMNGGRCR